MNATTYSCSIRSVPESAAAGIDSRRTARIASAAIISGRRRARSTKAPANRPMRRTAVDADATRMPTCNASACRVMTATIGSAVRVTTEPSSETVCPLQSFMKSACRQSDRAVTSIGRAACHT